MGRREGGGGKGGGGKGGGGGGKGVGGGGGLRSKVGEEVNEKLKDCDTARGPCMTDLFVPRMMMMC